MLIIIKADVKVSKTEGKTKLSTSDAKIRKTVGKNKQRSKFGRTLAILVKVIQAKISKQIFKINNTEISKPVGINTQERYLIW